MVSKHSRNTNSMVCMFGCLLVMNTFKVVRLEPPVTTVTNSSGVPQNLGPSTLSILIKDSYVPNLNRSSLVNYPKLLRLRIQTCGLEYVDEGTFDNNPLLEYLELVGEPLRQLPANLGPAQDSLKRVSLNRVSTPIRNLIGGNYFREFPKLTSLGIGGSHDLGPELDADILPRQLVYLDMSKAGIEIFPNLSAVVPGLLYLHIQQNYIQVIPMECISTLTKMKSLVIGSNLLATLPEIGFMKQLRLLYANDNQLTRLPDIYHLDLTNLKMANNPLVCDQALCWLRMWPLTRTSILEDKPTCASPWTIAGRELMGVHPVAMQCYNGKYSNIILNRSIIFSKCAQ